MALKGVYFRALGTLFIIAGLGVGVFLVQRVVRYLTGAGGTLANLNVDLYTEAGSVPDHWRNLAQGGEEKGKMLSSVLSQTRSLKPQYIRIDHVFDYYSDPNEIDPLIKDIISTGAKPFVSLSYMPPSISRSGRVDDLPNDWGKWEEKVQKLVEHISGKSGLAIDGVYYEVWNEPDLFGGFKMSGEKNYTELYFHTAKGVSRAKNVLGYKLGGPATTGFYPNWINGLIAFTSKNNLRLDFISWHRYSKNLSDYEKDMDGVKKVLEENGYQGMEVMITEMGTTGSNDESYDNTFGAVHEISVNTLLAGRISKAFTFEIKDGPGDKQYWGRWGIYTHEKFGPPVEKPRAKALRFLNEMIGGNLRNVSGQGSWVKSFAKYYPADNSTKVLVVNYDPEGLHNESVPITLTNLSFPNFTFKRTDFLGKSFSIDVATTSATWSTVEYFKPNTAAIFEIKPK